MPKTKEKMLEFMETKNKSSNESISKKENKKEKEEKILYKKHVDNQATSVNRGDAEKLLLISRIIYFIGFIPLAIILLGGLIFLLIKLTPLLIIFIKKLVLSLIL